MYTNPLAVGNLEEQRTSIACNHCTCPTKMLFVVHNKTNVTIVCVHVGCHAHHVALGECQETTQSMKKIVCEEAACSLDAPTSTIVLDVSKNWLTTAILALAEEIAMPFDSTFMKEFGNPFKNISYSNILNLVSFFQPSHAQKESIEKIPKLTFMRINTKSPKFSQF